MQLKKSLKDGSISSNILIFFLISINFIVDQLLGNNNLYIPLISTIILSSITTKWFITKLNNFKINQIIRLEGPKAHYKKAGTPTMGGIIIVPIGLLIGNILTITSDINSKIITISCITLAFMLIGAIDDWKSLVVKNNYGLSPKNKLIFQSTASIIFLIWTSSKGWLSPIINLPMGIKISTGIFLIPFCIFVFLAESNATNLTDGLDGLASGCGALVFSGLAIELSIRGGIENYLMSIFCSSMAGSWLGFLMHNKNPAKIFMGDTGSLAMGGALTGVALLTNSLWALLIMGGVFLLESLSVIIQVLIFKITKKYGGEGKRIWRMTPIHHHFELEGIDENVIVISFWLTTCCFIALALLIRTTY